MTSKYEIATKSHGHGDIHSLLFLTGTATKWLEQGLKWWIFFQVFLLMVQKSLMNFCLFLCFSGYEYGCIQKFDKCDGCFIST